MLSMGSDGYQVTPAHSDPHLALTSLVIVFGSSLRNTAHHFDKFVHINLSVSVFIDLGDGLVDLLLRVDVAELFTC